MKDEAIQAIIDEDSLRSSEENGKCARRSSKESEITFDDDDDEKEHCECLSDEVKSK